MAEAADQKAMDRRDLLKKAGVSAGVVWAVPVVQAITTPAYASTASNCTCDSTAWSATHVGWDEVSAGIYAAKFEIYGTFDCVAANRVALAGFLGGSQWINTTLINNGTSLLIAAYGAGDYPLIMSMSLVSAPTGDVICADCGTMELVTTLPVP